jgi:hypothetical protein
MIFKALFCDIATFIKNNPITSNNNFFINRCFLKGVNIFNGCVKFATRVSTMISEEFKNE